jgi:hypothetical protein
MFYKIESQCANIITQVNLSLSEWEEKLDRVESVDSFNDREELIKWFKETFNLSEVELERIVDCIKKNSNAKYFRYFGTTTDTFKFEPAHLNIDRIEGRLIYWKDWDCIFYQSGENFYLWCYIGGMSDMWKKIRLSADQIQRYKVNGFSGIDYLVNDIRNWKNSVEYPKAEREGRVIL